MKLYLHVLWKNKGEKYSLFKPKNIVKCEYLLMIPRHYKMIYAEAYLFTLNAVNEEKQEFFSYFFLIGPSKPPLS